MRLERSDLVIVLFIKILRKKDIGFPCMIRGLEADVPYATSISPSVEDHEAEA